MSYLVRGATGKDFDRIVELFGASGFKLEPKHLQALIVVEDIVDSENGFYSQRKLVGAGALSNILEGVLVLDNELPRKKRVQIFDRIMRQADVEARNAGFDNWHAFAANAGAQKLLKKHYGLNPVKAVEVLLKWVE